MSEVFVGSAQPPGRPTMREVAALAGVGLKTVSRVFNDVPTVDPALVRRTRDAADRLGYRPNLTASALRRSDRRTATIGLLLEDVANPFSAALHRAVEDAALERGSLVLTGSLDEDPARERELANILLDRQVDGLIIVPAGDDHSYLAPEQRSGTAFVFLDRPAQLLRADAVLSDNVDGARGGVEHLLRGGHRRIAYLGDDLAIPTAAARFEGYRAAMAAAGMTVDDSLVRHGLRTTAAAVAATDDLLSASPQPTALFCSQNLVTIGAVRALLRLGRQHEIAVVGFDDFLLADALDPGVTVVAQDVPAMGRLAAHLLFSQLAGEETTGRTHLVPTRLILRGSGELAPPA